MEGFSWVAAENGGTMSHQNPVTMHTSPKSRHRPAGSARGTTGALCAERQVHSSLDVYYRAIPLELRLSDDMNLPCESSLTEGNYQEKDRLYLRFPGGWLEWDYYDVPTQMAYIDAGGHHRPPTCSPA